MLGNGKGGSEGWVEGVERFAYPEAPWTDEFARVRSTYEAAFPGGTWHEGREGALDRVPSAGTRKETPPETAPAGIDPERVAAMIAEASRRSEERGHALGVDRGVALAREEGQRQLAAERARLERQAGGLAEEFAAEREQYFHRVEEEAVRLALAIAARILRREAQMDPLLLTGAVRVALGQLAEATTVRLRVPAADEPLWREAFEHMPGLRNRPAVVGDERMTLGDCRLETELGAADLGLRAQFREIERGFFDRVGGGFAGAGSERDNWPGGDAAGAGAGNREAR